jgi:hypothetical protein
MLDVIDNSASETMLSDPTQAAVLHAMAARDGKDTFDEDDDEDDDDVPFMIDGSSIGSIQSTPLNPMKAALLQAMAARVGGDAYEDDDDNDEDDLS